MKHKKRFGQIGCEGYWSGKKFSKEHREKISKGLKGKYTGCKSSMYGKHHTEKWKRDMSLIMSGKNNHFYGKTHSKENRMKISQSNKGRKLSEKTIIKIIQSNKGKHNDEKNASWKGDNVGYRALHQWIRKHLREPKLCHFCEQLKKLDLCNISGEYLRDINDWFYACRRCHIIYDHLIIPPQHKSHIKLAISPREQLDHI